MPKDTKTKMGNLTKYLILLITASFVLAGEANAQSSPSVVLYLSPSSAPITEGSKFTIDIRENSGNFKVNAVDIRMTYPDNKMEIDNDSLKISTPFSLLNKDQAVSSGSIRVIAATLSEPRYVYGDQSIATLTFKAKEDIDASKITINQSSSAIASCGKNLLKVQGDYSCTYTPPPPAAPAPTQPEPRNPSTSITRKPITSTIENISTPVKDDKISISIATPNAQRRQEQSQVGFWVPMLVLAGTLLASTMAASGFTAGGILKHFKFLRPINRFKHYPHL